MTSDKQLLEQVLEALESCMYPQQKQLQAITAIKQALAAPVQEPVALNAELLDACKHARLAMAAASQANYLGEYLRLDKVISKAEEKNT